MGRRWSKNQAYWGMESAFPDTEFGIRPWAFWAFRNFLETPHLVSGGLIGERRPSSRILSRVPSRTLNPLCWVTCFIHCDAKSVDQEKWSWLISAIRQIGSFRSTVCGQDTDRGEGEPLLLDGILQNGMYYFIDIINYLIDSSQPH